MSVVGLSLFIASVSFLFYRHPPSTWIFLRWLLRPLVPNEAERESLKAPPTPDVVIEPTEPPNTTHHDPEPQETPILETNPEKDMSKIETDRKAMPPPPLIFKKTPPKRQPEQQSPTSSPPTPRASDYTAPTFTLSEPDLPRPSFPALNSAQRASGGTPFPPRLKQYPDVLTTTSGPGLMGPPQRSPLPNRGPPSSSSASSSLALPPSHTSIPTKPRKKVLLTPGHSPLDWARLSSSPNANLRGIPASTPYLRVPPSLLKQYTGRKGKDAWTILGGKVYNITPYLPYHPGGEPELLRAAGRDGTKLFGDVHPWVNWEGMLEGCLVGIAVEEGDIRAGVGPMEEMD